jgi:HemY protein
VLSIVVGGVLLMAALNAVSGLLALPRRAGEWRAVTRERAGQAALREALAEYFGAATAVPTRRPSARWRSRPTRGCCARTTEFTALAHLLAAGSLHRLQDRPRRDEQLDRVLRLLRKTGAGRSADDGARLLAAEWALDDRDAARALDLLAELPPGVARRTQALRLKLRAARMASQPLQALPPRGCWPSTRPSRRRLRRACCVRWRWRRWTRARRRPAAPPLAAARRRRPARPLVSARGEAVGCAGRRRRGSRLAASVLGAPGRLRPRRREQLALALIACIDGIGADWLPRLEMALQTHGHEPPWPRRWARPSPSAGCGARRGACSSRPPPHRAARRRAPPRLAPPGATGARRRRRGTRRACEHEASVLD